ncbi:MAG: hypothetical protein J6T34_01060 [Bacilli bacterium]|nr:hypothetical protein [Bacilli bacterium]
MPGAAGIVAVIDATPFVTVAFVLLNLTPVKVPVLLVFPFQLVISLAVIPAAADAENTGSASVKDCSAVSALPNDV